MDVLLGITGKDFVIIGASKAAMRGVTILKATDDKTRKLSEHCIMAYSGEAGDTVQFAEYIQANIALYQMRHGSTLQPPAIASYTRNELATSLRSRNPYNVNILLGGVETPSAPPTPSSNNPSEPTTQQAPASAVRPKLYWCDYLATLAEVPYAAHGYAQYYCLSTLDKHHNPNISLDQGLKILRMCADELRRRLPIDYKGLEVTVIDKDGSRKMDFADDANIKGA